MFSRISSIFFVVLFALLAVAAPLPVEERAVSLGFRKGSMTWYHPGLGNCGGHDNDKSMIVAIPTKDYAGGKHCGKHITITAKGHTITALVRDSCPDCAPGQIDASPAVFKKFAGLGVGLMDIQWKLPGN